MKQFLPTHLTALCAAALVVYNAGNVQAAETIYPPPYIIDAQGKVVGHYDSSTLLIRVPNGPLVALKVYADSGFLKRPGTRETNYFYFITKNCTGEEYIEYNGNPPLAFIDSSKREVVYTSDQPKVRTFNSIIESANGKPHCRSLPGFTATSAQSATYPIDALGFSPPFSVNLGLPQTAGASVFDDTTQTAFPPPWVIDDPGKVVGHLSDNNVLMRIPNGPLVTKSFYGPTGFDRPPTSNYSEVYILYWTGDHCTGDQYLNAANDAPYAYYDKVKGEFVYPSERSEMVLLHSQTVYDGGVVTTPCANFGGRNGHELSAAQPKTYPVNALGFKSPFRIKLK